MLPITFRANWTFGSGEARNRFSRWPPCGHLGLLIGTILAIFHLFVTPMLPTNFGVNLPFGSGVEAKNRFSRWLPWRPSCISDRHDFSYFLSTSNPDASYQLWSQLVFRFNRRSEKQIFKMVAMAAILDFRSARYWLFLIYKSPRCFYHVSSQLAFWFRRRSEK